MTVLDTSAVVDLLLGSGTAEEVSGLMSVELPAAAPDVIVFEVLAVLRREVARGTVPESRADAAVHDLGDVSLTLFPAMPLRGRAWELRHNMTAADALFVALAERLDEPLATRDDALASSAQQHARAEVILLGAS